MPLSRGWPVPFAAVHLLFINLLTDSLPAIALGLEPHSDAVMQEKPRPRSEGILTKPFLLSVGTEGLVIALATIIAFHIGLASGGAAVASTMAFATLCLSRLFHGFNCKSGRPVLFTRAFWNNKFLLGAFAVGALLLAAVLLDPTAGASVPGGGAVCRTGGLHCGAGLRLHGGHSGLKSHPQHGQEVNPLQIKAAGPPPYGAALFPYAPV